MDQTIAQAVEQMKNTVFDTSLDEAAIKQGVVLRLLNLCGWDQFDLSQIKPEYTVGNRRVDYALIPHSDNKVFIEVKRIREDLANHEQQLLEYCFQEGVRLATLTNGRIWHLYLPMQPGSWEGRRFLTIDLGSQEPVMAEQLFMEYLSRESVGSGKAVNLAEDLIRSQERMKITSRTIVKAWNQIIETPDESLIDLIADTTEHLCGITPEPELVKQFLSQRAKSIEYVSEESPSPAPSPRRRPHVGRHGDVLPITLDPPDHQDFKNALLQTKEAWIEESYSDGQKQVDRWDASHMKPSSNVIGNLRSRPRYRQGSWQKEGIARLRVSITRPGSI